MPASSSQCGGGAAPGAGFRTASAGALGSRHSARGVPADASDDAPRLHPHALARIGTRCKQTSVLRAQQRSAHADWQAWKQRLAARSPCHCRYGKA